MQERKSRWGEKTVTSFVSRDKGGKVTHGKEEIGHSTFYAKKRPRVGREAAYVDAGPEKHAAFRFAEGKKKPSAEGPKKRRRPRFSQGKPHIRSLREKEKRSFS